MSTSNSRLGGALLCVFFILAGVVVLYDASGYSDRDSRVFPQTVAIIMIVFAVVSLIATAMRMAEVEGFGEGIWWRRVLLIIAMLGACLIMPFTGFIPASVVAFAGGLIAAQHDGWSVKTGMIFSLVGGLVVVAFYVLFKHILLVPLP